MKTSVVIPDHNTLPAAIALAKRLREVPLVEEVIIVENGREVDTVMSGPRPPIHVVENRGFGAAVNYGARLARAEGLLICNPDISFDRPARAIAALVSPLTDPGVGAVGPSIHRPDGKPETTVSARSPSLLDSTLRKIRPHSAPATVENLTGACLAIRRETFLALGGFDESYFMYFEDADLCLRVRRAGLRLMRVDVPVCHSVGASPTAPGARQTWYRDSQARFFRRWRPYPEYLVVRAAQRMWRHAGRG